MSVQHAHPNEKEVQTDHHIRETNELLNHFPLTKERILSQSHVDTWNNLHSHGRLPPLQSIDVASNSSDGSNGSQSLRSRIIHDLIHPAYYKDVQSNTYWRYTWSKIKNGTQTAGKVISGASAILAFASAGFGLTYLGFIAGCCSTVSCVIFQFSTYAGAQSRQRHQDVNLILHDLHIHAMPDLKIDEIIENGNQNS